MSLDKCSRHAEKWTSVRPLHPAFQREGQLPASRVNVSFSTFNRREARVGNARAVTLSLDFSTSFDPYACSVYSYRQGGYWELAHDRR